MSLLPDADKSAFNTVDLITAARLTVELLEIDAVLDQAMNALESDADRDQRQTAFEAIQALYESGKLLCRVLDAVEAAADEHSPVSGDL